MQQHGQLSWCMDEIWAGVSCMIWGGVRDRSGLEYMYEIGTKLSLA